MTSGIGDIELNALLKTLTWVTVIIQDVALAAMMAAMVGGVLMIPIGLLNALLDFSSGTINALMFGVFTLAALGSVTFILVMEFREDSHYSDVERYCKEFLTTPWKGVMIRWSVPEEFRDNTEDWNKFKNPIAVSCPRRQVVLKELLGYPMVPAIVTLAIQLYATGGGASWSLLLLHWVAWVAIWYFGLWRNGADVRRLMEKEDYKKS